MSAAVRRPLAGSGDPPGRCGGTPSASRSPHGRHSKVTLQLTWRSSAPATRGCGPRIYLAERRPDTPDRRARAGGRGFRGFRAKRRAGAPHSSPRPTRGSQPSTASSRRSPCTEPCATTVDEVGRGLACARHRLRLREGRDRRCRKERRPTGAGEARGGRRVASSASQSATCGWSMHTRRGDEIGATGVLGAVVNPHCAAVHPARLARGLASAGRSAAR